MTRSSLAVLLLLAGCCLTRAADDSAGGSSAGGDSGPFYAGAGRVAAPEPIAGGHVHPRYPRKARKAEAEVKWRYKPALLEGEPVDVYFDIVVEFRLDQETSK